MAKNAPRLESGSFRSGEGYESTGSRGTKFGFKLSLAKN